MPFIYDSKSLLAQIISCDFYFNGIKKYSCLGGRSSRKDFFSFIISTIILGFGLIEIGKIHPLIASIYPLFVIFSFPPVIAITVRRLHDVGKSGWFLLAAFISLCVIFVSIGFYNLKAIGEGATLVLYGAGVVLVAYFLVLLTKKGNEDENKYNNSKSHPIRDGIILLFIISFPIFIVYALNAYIENPPVLKQSNLSHEEFQKIDKLVKQTANPILNKFNQN